MDCGFAAAGWAPLWQAECDAHRAAVLRRRFPGAHVYNDVTQVGRQAAVPDVLYADIPDSRIDRWWPPLARVLALVGTERWFVVEFSPTVRFESIIRDLALGRWAFRLVAVTTTIQMDGVAPEEWDCRKRSYVLASPDPKLVDALGLAAFVADLVITGVSTTHARGTVEWHEATRGFRDNWTCVCDAVAGRCICDPTMRALSVNDAASPYMGRWLADLLDGTWTDGRDRGLTHAAGGMV